MVTKSDKTRAWTFAKAMINLLPAGSEVLHTRQNDGQWMVSAMDLPLLNTVLAEAKAARSSQISVVELTTAQAEALNSERISAQNPVFVRSA
jgi:hypothetical protein